MRCRKGYFPSVRVLFRRMPFRANASRRRRIPKQRHRIRNWAEYDAGLRARGSLTVWFRAGLADMPAGASTAQLYGVALLCGIGFTMSLFIGALAFPTSPELGNAIKVGVWGRSSRQRQEPSCSAMRPESAE